MRKNINTRQSNKRTQLQLSGEYIKYDISTQKTLRHTQNGSQGVSLCSNQIIWSRKQDGYDIIKDNNKQYKYMYINGLFNKMIQRRKRYSIQLMKLIYMFPDDQYSQNISVSSYDRLIFQDQQIHSFVKIYETKEMQRIIWSFLNIKNIYTKKKLEQFIIKIEEVKTKINNKLQKIGFNIIYQYSLKIKYKQSSQVPLINIQRQQPINTKLFIQKQYSQSTKTQRIQRNINNNYISQKQHSVIRITTMESSPLVKRIQVSPQDIKILCPSKINNQYSSHSRKIITDEIHHTRKQNIHYTSNTNLHSKYNYYSNSDDYQTRTIYPTKSTRVEQKKRQLYQSPSIIYREQKKYKIQPTPVQSTIYTQSQSNKIYNNKEVQDQYQSYYGQNALVHVVHGNCTINIHNTFVPSSQSNRICNETQQVRKRSISNYSNSSNNLPINSQHQPYPKTFNNENSSMKQQYNDQDLTSNCNNCYYNCQRYKLKDKISSCNETCCYFDNDSNIYQSYKEDIPGRRGNFY